MVTPISIRLAIRQWLARPLRPVLCSLAIAAAVALIISVGAAMDSLQVTVAHAIGQALGVAQVHVRPAQRETDARVPHAILERVRALPEVELVDGRLISRAQVTRAGDPAPQEYDVVGIEEPTDDKLRPKIMDAGRTVSPTATDEINIDSQIAKDMKLTVGDTVVYTVKDTPPQKLKLVGIVHRPTIEFIARPTLYVPLSSLARDLKAVGEYNVLDLKLKDTNTSQDFDQYAKDLGKLLGPSVDVAPGTNSKANMADMTRTLRLMLIMLSTISALCAALIIGTTLSVGVQERVRQFGQLRRIGASRGQLAVSAGRRGGDDGDRAGAGDSPGHRTFAGGWWPYLPKTSLNPLNYQRLSVAIAARGGRVWRPLAGCDHPDLASHECVAGMAAVTAARDRLRMSARAVGRIHRHGAPYRTGIAFVGGSLLAGCAGFWVSHFGRAVDFFRVVFACARNRCFVGNNRVVHAGRHLFREAVVIKECVVADALARRRDDRGTDDRRDAFHNRAGARGIADDQLGRPADSRFDTQNVSHVFQRKAHHAIEEDFSGTRRDSAVRLFHRPSQGRQSHADRENPQRRR